MNAFNWMDLLSYSIVPAALLGIIQYRRMEPEDRPFAWLLLLGLIEEVASSILIRTEGNNTVIGNVYTLLELWCFIWLFYRWANHILKRRALVVAAIVLSLVWVGDTIATGGLEAPNSLYRIAYSSVLAVIAAERMAAITLLEDGNMLRNPSFIICTGMLFYYSYEAYVEILYVLDLQIAPNFYKHLFLLLGIINAGTNVLYTIACLWLPTKRKLSLRYS